MKQIHDHSLGLKKLKLRMANIKVMLVVEGEVDGYFVQAQVSSYTTAYVRQDVYY